LSVLDIHGSFLAFMQASKRAGATSMHFWTRARRKEAGGKKRFSSSGGSEKKS
jgi:hypothetical protein